MAWVTVNDLDYLTARFHGRRGRVADGERLDELCRLDTIPDLTRAVFPDAEFETCAQFQCGALEDLIQELSRATRFLDRAGSDLLAWTLARFQVENMKVLLRGFMDHTPLEVLREHLVPFPQTPLLDAQALLAAESLDQWIDRLPNGRPRKALQDALGTYRDQPRPFFFEAALDRGYCQELLDRARQLSGEDQELVAPLVDQEVNTFQLMLVTRGRFSYGLPGELLSPLHIRGCGIPAEQFHAMLQASDLRTAATFAVGRAIDALPAEHDSKETAPADAAELEALAWKRFLRLANRAFRRSHMGLGAVIGYAGIRRVELANLITLSEGMRARVGPEAIRARLIPRHDKEAAHV